MEGLKEKQQTEAPCSVCGQGIAVKYCSNCGQLRSGKAVTMRNMAMDMATNLFSLEKSIVPAVLKITRKPEPIIRNYWEGNKKYYPSPGKMLVYALAAAGLHLTFVNENLLGFNVQLDHVSAQIAFFVLILPLLSLVSRIVFYKRKNFAFHVVSIVYLSTAFLMLLLFLNFLFLKAGLDLKSAPGMVFLLMVLGWNARVFYPADKAWRILLLTLLQLLALAAVVAGIVGINSLLKYLLH